MGAFVPPLCHSRPLPLDVQSFQGIESSRSETPIPSEKCHVGVREKLRAYRFLHNCKKYIKVAVYSMNDNYHVFLKKS